MSYLEGVGTGAGLSIADLQARMQDMRSQRFADADTDGSGGLSEEEFSAGVSDSPFAGVFQNAGRSTSDMFGKLDADGDGNLTEAEMEEANPFNGGGAMSSNMMNMLLQIQELGGGLAGGPGSPLALDLNAMFGQPPEQPSGGADPISDFLDALSGEEDEQEESQ